MDMLKTLLRHRADINEQLCETHLITVKEKAYARENSLPARSSSTGDRFPFTLDTLLHMSVLHGQVGVILLMGYDVDQK